MSISLTSISYKLPGVGVKETVGYFYILYLLAPKL